MAGSEPRPAPKSAAAQSQPVRHCHGGSGRAEPPQLVAARPPLAASQSLATRGMAHDIELVSALRQIAAHSARIVEQRESLALVRDAALARSEHMSDEPEPVARHGPSHIRQLRGVAPNHGAQNCWHPPTGEQDEALVAVAGDDGFVLQLRAAFKRCGQGA